MKASTVFYKVYAHLLEQGKQAINDNGKCLYRGPDGTKCAVGALIRDREYDPEMENSGGVGGLKREGLLPERLKPHYELLKDLQDEHDENIDRRGDSKWFKTKSLHERMRRVAESHGIKFVEMELV